MTVALTAAQDSAFPPRILVQVSGLTADDVVTVYRVYNSTRTALRGADTVTVSDTTFNINDGEYPFGVPLEYVANVNDVDAAATQESLFTEDFESGVALWTPVDATFVQDTTHPHAGTDSGLLTVVGSPLQAYTRADVDVVAGDHVTATMWVFATSALAHVTATIDWLDTAGTFLSSSAADDVTLVTSTQTELTVTGTAPAGAATASVGPTLGSSPAADTALWVDDVTVSRDGSLLTPVLPGGNVVISDAITGQSVECLYYARPNLVQTRQGTRFDIGDRSMFVSAPRAGGDADAQFITLTEAAREDMLDLLKGATAGIVLVRTPDVATYPGLDGHYIVTADTESFMVQDGTSPKRMWTLSLVETAGWASTLTASGWTLADIEDAYTDDTLADIESDFAADELLDIEIRDWGQGRPS